MVGYLARADQVLAAGDLVGEDRADEILGAHAGELRRHLAAAAEARQGERDADRPAPAGGEHRRVEQRLDQHVADARRMEIAFDVVERETMRGGQRQDDVVLGRGRLDLEIELAAEALAQRQAPRAVESAAIGRMDDELHAADLVEEALEDERLLRRQAAERRLAGGEILDELARSRLDDADLADQEIERAGARGIAVEAGGDVAAQPRHCLRELVAAPRRLAEPERDGRRRALGIGDAHRAALDADDAIGGVAELEDVAGQALDGEILVDRADDLALRLEQHLVIGIVGDRAARGQRRHPCAAPSAQHLVDRVVMDERAAPAAPRAEPVGEHAQNGGEILARQGAIGIGAAAALVERVLAPFLRRHLGDDLLRQHVERLLRDAEPVELAAADAVEQSGAFDQLVAREREEPSLGRAVDGVAGAADALQEAGDRARRGKLADEIDLADIDAELERGGGDQRLQAAVLQPLLGREALLLGEAAVMRRDMRGADAVGELAGDALGHAPRVDEDQGRAVLGDEGGEAIIDLGPDLRRHHRFERRGRHLEPEIARPAMAGIDDPAGRRRALRSGTDQELRDRLDRLLRRREADAQQLVAAQRRQTLERHSEMGAALVRRHGMDLVDDHRPRRLQHGAAGFRAEQDVERFRGGDDDMRRAAPCTGALALRRVAGAHPAADLDLGQAPRAQLRTDPGERRFEVLLDVVGERLKRRDIDDLCLVPELARQPLADQPVDRGEKGGQRLARAGRRRDQHVLARLDRRPRRVLRRRRRREIAREPGGDCGMEEGGWGHGRRRMVGTSGNSRDLTTKVTSLILPLPP